MQERMIRGQLGEPRRWGHTQNNKVLQQLPEPRHCLPLHLLQFSSGKLLPLLLHKLHLRLSALLNLLFVLPLRLSKGCWLQKLCDELLNHRDCW
jgi:hypothetical protein